MFIMKNYIFLFESVKYRAGPVIEIITRMKEKKSFIYLFFFVLFLFLYTKRWFPFEKDIGFARFRFGPVTNLFRCRKIMGRNIEVKTNVPLTSP